MRQDSDNTADTDADADDYLDVQDWETLCDIFDTDTDTGNAGEGV